jgi:hypothetical protein
LEDPGIYERITPKLKYIGGKGFETDLDLNREEYCVAVSMAAK